MVEPLGRELHEVHRCLRGGRDLDTLDEHELDLEPLALLVVLALGDAVDLLQGADDASHGTLTRVSRREVEVDGDHQAAVELAVRQAANRAVGSDLAELALNGPLERGEGCLLGQCASFVRWVGTSLFYNKNFDMQYIDNFKEEY